MESQRPKERLAELEIKIIMQGFLYLQTAGVVETYDEFVEKGHAEALRMSIKGLIKIPQENYDWVKMCKNIREQVWDTATLERDPDLETLELEPNFEVDA